MALLQHSKKLLLLVIFLTGSLKISAAIFGSTVVCANTSIQYYSSSYPTGYTFQWTVMGAAQVTPNGQYVAVTWGSAGSGTVKLIVKNASGTIVFNQTKTITIKPVPAPKIIPLSANGCYYPLPPKPGDGTLTVQPDSTDACYIVCDSSIFKYSAALPDATQSYTWTVLPASAALGTTVTGLGLINIKWGAPSNLPIKLRLYQKDIATGCSDTVDICIRIIARPNAIFSTFPAAINSTVNVCLNATVGFNDLSTTDFNSSIASWYWTFGDGTSSILQNPSHTYTTAGTFVTKLLVKNQCQCRDSMMVTVKVNTQPGPDINCISPVCFSSTASYCTNYSCTPYTWSVTNGVVTNTFGTNGKCINVNWGNKGPGSITLQGGSCLGACPYPTTVLVPILPSTVAIQGATYYACANTTHTYSVPIVPGTTYSWSAAGTGTILAGQGTNIISFYTGAASTAFTLNVNYYNALLNCSGTASLAVGVTTGSYIKPTSDLICLGDAPLLLLWDVSGAGLIYGGPSIIAITDPLGVTTYNWLMMPGIPNNFTMTGTYFIADASAGYQNCNNQKPYPIQVVAPPPTPTAIGISNVICPGQTMLYTAAPSSVNYFLKWAVTGGVVTQSSGNAISVTWNMTGPWSMTLTQQDIMPPGCVSPPLIFNMNASPPPIPVINSSTVVCENGSLAFSTPALADSYNWAVVPSTAGSILLGNSPTSMTLQVNNNTAGTATVYLQVTQCGQSSTQSKTLSIKAMPTPTINIPVLICQNTSVSFIGATLGTNYSWTFGGSTQAVGQVALNTFYTPGTFTVGLAVTDPGSCIGATSYATRTVNVVPAPIASITSPNNLGACTNGAPFSYSLYTLAQTQPGTPTFTWWPIPSSTFSVLTSFPGPHSVTVNLNGCTATNTVVITTTNCPSGGSTGTATGCSFATGGTHQCYFTFVRNCNFVYFNPVIVGAGGAVVSWTLGDPANTTSTLYSPSITYNSAGFYSVKLLCGWPALGGGLCYRDTTLTVAIPIKADFKYTFSCGSGNGLITNFIDQSTYIPTNPIISRSWLINPGSLSSSATNPAFALAPGIYTVQLTIMASGSTVICTSTQTLLVPTRPTPSFTAPNTICEGNALTFSSTSSPTNAVLNYLWNFGDFTGLFKSSPTLTAIKAYVFSLPVIKNTFLTITDIYNCSSTFGAVPVLLKQNLFSSTNVAVTPTSSLICQGDSVQLCAISISTNNPNPNVPFTYLWSNSSSSVCTYAKQSGPFSVIFTDAFGCKSKPAFGSVNTVIVPVPLVSGDRSYCMGEKPALSIDRGTGYTYRWVYNYSGSNTTTACGSGLFPPPTVFYITTIPFVVPYCSPLTPSIAANFTGTINLQGLITENSSGLNCTAKSPTVNVVIRPLPPKPTVITNQCVKTVPINLTASGSGGVSMLWNTGAQGNTISVNNPSKYWASVVDNFGCKSIADTAIVWPLPDLNSMMYGCVSICDTGTTTVPVPPGYTQYTWIKKGYGIVAGPSATPINLAFNNPSTLPGGNAGQYRLALQTANGCVDTSKTLDISIKPCRTCTMSATATFSCNTTNSTTPSYNFTMNVNNGAASPVTYTIACSNGTLSNLSPSTTVFSAGANTLLGKFTPSANTLQCCITFTVKFADESICFYTKCLPVPPCFPPKCVLQPTLTVNCIGVSNGNPIYNYSLLYNNTATVPGTLTVNSAQGNISTTTTPSSPGANILNGNFTDIPTYDGTFCLNVYLSNTLTGWCYQQVCKPLPTVAPCFTVSNNCTAINTNSIIFSNPTLNVLGQPVYNMSLTLSSSSGSHSFYIMSAQGIVGPSNSTLINTTPSVRTNTFVQTQPLLAGSNLCFTIVATNLANGQKCKKPFCVVISSGGGGGNRLIDNVVINLYPNPTGDYTIAEYSLDNIEPLPQETAGYNQISIIDLNGREVVNVPLAQSSGNVEINTAGLIPGLYFLRAMNNNNVLMVKKLIIQR